MLSERFSGGVRFIKSRTSFALAVLLGVVLWVAFPPTNETLFPGTREPGQRFFVLVTGPEYTNGINVTRYEMLPEIRVKDYTFLMPNDSGTFKMHRTEVSYRVERISPDLQNVEVTYKDEEGLKVFTRYEARHRKITPLVYRETYWLIGLKYVFIAVAAWLCLFAAASAMLAFDKHAKRGV